MACIIQRSLRDHWWIYFSFSDGMFRCSDVQVQRKMVKSEPQRMSNVPRPFGWLTHPSRAGEAVVPVVLVADAGPRYRVIASRRDSIATSVQCTLAEQDLGIAAASGLRRPLKEQFNRNLPLASIPIECPKDRATEVEALTGLIRLSSS